MGANRLEMNSGFGLAGAACRDEPVMSANLVTSCLASQRPPSMPPSMPTGGRLTGRGEIAALAGVMFAPAGVMFAPAGVMFAPAGVMFACAGVMLPTAAGTGPAVTGELAGAAR